MAVQVMMMMAAQSGSKTNCNNAEVKNPAKETTTFHDFMGMSCPSDSHLVLSGDAVRLSEASASAGASSGVVRGPFSTTSDLGSERQLGSHFEGVPFYGPRGDLSGAETSNRLTGSKRSNSDSAFMGSSRDGIPLLGAESSESSHLMKILRRGVGGEWLRRSNDEEILYGMQTLRPTSPSLILQPPDSTRVDPSFSKWERSPMNAGPPKLQYPPRSTLPFMHQVHPSRFRDANAGPSIISQAAADEGSRTGIKGSGILSSINANSGGVSDKSQPGGMNGARPVPRVHISEPESSYLLSRNVANRQMTIFYGGQAHVFDDVHPNKADVIMALAGSNGGSWSTTYSPKSSTRQAKESYMATGENEMGTPSNVAFLRECYGKSSVIGNSAPKFSSGDRIPTPTGVHQGSLMAKDISNMSREAEQSSDGKRET